MPEDELFEQLEADLNPVSHMELHLGLSLYGLIDVLCNPDEYEDVDNIIEGMLDVADQYYQEWLSKYEDYIEPLLEQE